MRADKRYGRAIGFRYHDGKPGIIEGLLSRGDRRVGAVIEAVWRDGGRFDGWSEHFSYDRWTSRAETALAGTGVDLDWYTTRERDYDEVLPVGPPRLRPRQGLAVGGLGGRARCADDSDVEVEDCRWTPCYDCGVCPEMGTEIQIGPTGQKLLPLASSDPSANRFRDGSARCLVSGSVRRWREACPGRAPSSGRRTTSATTRSDS